MKKILVAVAITLLGASAAFASNITATKHNLSSGASGSQVRGSTNQICAFCHTPHNAVPNVPLWNRNATGNTYKLYTSSGTLGAAAKGASLPATSISLLCLSCHDGTLANLGDRVTNKPGGTAITMTDGTGNNAWVTSGANLGADLTNDHPIGFSYTTAVTQESNLNVIATATTRGAVFFGAAKDRIECSSCHMVHDNTYSPFLRTTNANSALCLACHIK